MASTSSSGRSYDSIDDEEISTIIDESIPKNTKKQTSWSVGIFKGKVFIQKVSFETTSCSFVIFS